MRQIKFMGRFLAIFMLALLITGCGDNDTVIAAPQTISLTSADSGKSLIVRSNDLLKITLDGNPTTGYTWSVSDETGTILKQDGDPQYTPSASGNMIAGSGGTYLFTFKAVQQGTAPLKFKYSQAWNPKGEAASTFEITVTVIN